MVRTLLSDALYDVRPDGTIWTLVTQSGKKSVSNTWRKAGSIRAGYLRYRFSYKGSFLAIHRVIYARFNGQLKADLVINHIDGNPLNNIPSNLELVTQRRNLRVGKRP